MWAHLHYWLGLPTGVAFFMYGVSCLGTDTMRVEFARFGLTRFRVFIGVTQLLGAAALFLATWFPWCGFIGATGLAVQMAAGVGVRIRIRDTMLQAAQAGGFLVITLMLATWYGSVL